MVSETGQSRQPAETLWDVADVASYLKVSESTIRAYVLRREIPFLRIGSLIRFRRDEIDAWIENGRAVPPREEGAA